jgi:putative NIF3 family GTP cyclohydrolase 1 type 2
VDKSAEQPFFCAIEPITLRQVGEWVKKQLGLPMVRIVGDLSMECQRIVLLPGAPPSEWQMASLLDADVLIAGEINEWETNEYVRDATHMGLRKGLIVIGHAASEEPGMRLIIPWLQERLAGVPIHFVPTGSPFQYV